MRNVPPPSALRAPPGDNAGPPDGPPLANATLPVNQEIARNFREWGRISRNNYVWSYACNFTHYYAPWPNFDTMLPNIDFFLANGVKSVIYQGTHTSHGTEFHALRLWTIAKKLWNPTLDNHQLMQTFIEEYCGPAAPFVWKYIDALQAPIRNTTVDVGTQGCYQPINAPYLRPDVVAELEANCREAHAAAAGREPYARRVRHMNMPVWYVLVRRGMDSPTWAAVEKKVGAKLELPSVSASLLQVMDDYKMGGPSDTERKPEGFGSWLESYPAMVEKAGTHLLAPDARDVGNLARYWQSWRSPTASFLERTGLRIPRRLTAGPSPWTVLPSSSGMRSATTKGSNRGKSVVFTFAQERETPRSDSSSGWAATWARWARFPWRKSPPRTGSIVPTRLLPTRR
jgi:hypothetical protein